LDIHPTFGVFFMAKYDESYKLEVVQGYAVALGKALQRLCKMCAEKRLDAGGASIPTPAPGRRRDHRSMAGHVALSSS
jgi:hypothetical protein